MRNTRIILPVAVAAMLMAASLMAQPGNETPPGWSPMGGQHHRGRQMAENIENLRLLKLLETIDLTEDQSAKFIPLFQDFRKNFRELRDQRRDLVDHLADLVDSNATDGELNAGIQELIDLGEKMEKQRDDFLSECRSILTTKQLAKLVIFQERFEREILQSLREFRQRHP